MEHEGSLPSSQKLATCPWPETDEFNPHPHILLFTYFILSPIYS
jgi:hypothetical protein